ncbi:unnamed protein product [Echinostoma caproni]|uniref:Uncharacterized protein n=1 Tax=Echinostoma caproni TaxID=27848 RepID=A0A183A374_9TREM|nr:unnamed protein product [Echinostoma caproni]
MATILKERRMMEGGTKKAPASEPIENETHPTRRSDVAAGSTSRDNVDYHPKRTNRQLQPDRRSAASQKDIHRMPLRRSCRSAYLAMVGSNQPERQAEEETTYVPNADQNQQKET